MTEQPYDPDATIEEVEGNAWGDPAADATTLMTTVHAVRRKPLRSLDPEDLRIMILQRLSVPLLMPLAVRVLEDDPFAAGDEFPGALLEAVLMVPSGFWADHPVLADRLDHVCEQALLAEPDGDWRVEQRVADETTKALIDAFRRSTVAVRGRRASPRAADRVAASVPLPGERSPDVGTLG